MARVVFTEDTDFAGSYPVVEPNLGDLSNLYRYFGCKSPVEYRELMGSGDPFAGLISVAYVALRHGGVRVTVQQVADLDSGQFDAITEPGDDIDEPGEPEVEPDPTTPSVPSGGAASTSPAPRLSSKKSSGKRS